MLRYYFPDRRLMSALNDFVGSSSGAELPWSTVGTGTRSRIIALAVYQLKNGGYAELHFGAIASALGVTRANIHHHFSSEENLAQVAVEEFIEERLCRVQAMIDPFSNDFPSALNSIGEYLQQLSFRSPRRGAVSMHCFSAEQHGCTLLTQGSIH